MERRHEIIILAIALSMAIISAGCTQQPVGPESGVTPTPATTAPALTIPAGGVPNPAATYCRNMSNTYEIRTDSNGSQYGVCILPDGTVCDEWEYFRGNCTVATAPGGAITDPAENFCLSKLYIYQTRTDQNGTETGYCVFPDGKECEAQEFLKGKCTEMTAVTP